MLGYLFFLVLADDNVDYQVYHFEMRDHVLIICSKKKNYARLYVFLVVADESGLPCNKQP